MARISSGIKQKDEILMNPPYSSPISSSLSAPNYQKDSSSIRISPVLLLVIAILALVIVFLGILHLLIKIIIKSPTFSQIYNSNRNPDDSSTPNGLQGQLQQLFRLHDSGLDQNAIDALPVFYYRDVVMGLKEPFDCAVCLSEFSDMDKLRLLANCSHAFHIYCIDTWLLSNSTCPLCRGTLLSPNYNFDFNLEFSRVFCDAEGGSSSGRTVEETNNRDLGSKRVFSVRLGKFRSRNETEAGEDDHGQSQSQIQNGRTASGSDLAGSRRCYSMGAFQYLVCDKDFLVEVSDSEGKRCGDVAKVDSAIDGDLEEQKKIGERCKGESFSVSKIWLWSKKNNRLTPASSSPSSSSVSTLSCADRNFMRL